MLSAIQSVKSNKRLYLLLPEQIFHVNVIFTGFAERPDGPVLHLIRPPRNWSIKHKSLDNKTMRLVPKSIILFIRQLQRGHLQSTFLIPAHTFTAVLPLFVAFLERILWDVV
jgi:hypothetical protein